MPICMGTKKDENGNSKGDSPLWQGFGGVPHLLNDSPQEWGSGG
jgi:hypothetical protein